MFVTVIVEGRVLRPLGLDLLTLLQGRQSVGTPSAGPAAPVQRSDRFKDEEPAQGRTRMVSYIIQFCGSIIRSEH